MPHIDTITGHGIRDLSSVKLGQGTGARFSTEPVNNVSNIGGNESLRRKSIFITVRMRNIAAKVYQGCACTVSIHIAESSLASCLIGGLSREGGVTSGSFHG